MEFFGWGKEAKATQFYVSMQLKCRGIQYIHILSKIFIFYRFPQLYYVVVHNRSDRKQDPLEKKKSGFTPLQGGGDDMSHGSSLGSRRLCIPPPLLRINCIAAMCTRHIPYTVHSDISDTEPYVSVVKVCLRFHSFVQNILFRCLNFVSRSKCALST